MRQDNRARCLKASIEDIYRYNKFAVSYGRFKTVYCHILQFEAYLM